MKTAKDQKVAVITGASSGIGKEAAKALVNQGWRVIGVGRNPGRCEEAKGEILQQAGEQDQVHFICADLALMSDTRRTAREIAEITDRLDVLANNAGGLTAALTITPEGNENTFASNHLGHFLLTQLLLPLLEKAATAAAPARIVNVASAAHEHCTGLDWDDLQMLNGFSSNPAYCRAKLANILFTRELATRLNGRNIVVHAMHPGVVASNFASHGDEAMQSYMQASSETMISPALAADTLVWLCVAPEPGKSTGGYYHERTCIETSAAGQDDAAARRLWKESEKLVARA